MARQPRVEYEGAWYHVISRGDRREPIFTDDQDRHLFLKTLGEVCVRTGWKVASYVLMDNHFHLQLHTPEANLVAGMKWFLGVYTLRFNRRHRLCGHLFQGRYKAIPIEEGDYLLRVADYIHLNPVRAGWLKGNHRNRRLRHYRWSSMPSAAGVDRKPPLWLESRWLWSWAGLNPEARSTPQRWEARLESLAAQEERGEGPDWKDLRRGWCVGREEFAGKLLKKVRRHMRMSKRDSFQGPAVAQHDEAAAEEWLQKCLRRLQLNEALLAQGGKGMEQKRWLAWVLRRQTMASRTWIAQRLGMGVASRVSRAVSEVEANQALVRRLQKTLLTD